MRSHILFLLLGSFIFISGCSAIGDIFKAGAFVGILVVVVIIAVIAFIVKMVSSKN